MPYLSLRFEGDNTAWPIVPTGLGGQNNIDLSNGTDGFTLVEWRQGAAAPGAASVLETFTLQVEGTTKDNLATNLQLLDWFITRIAELRSTNNIRRRVMLHRHAENETESTAALVISAERSINITVDREPAKTSNFIAEFTLTIERAPVWEASSLATTTAIVGQINVTGGIRNFTGVSGGVVHGTQPARPDRVLLYFVSGSGTLTEFWYGFRSVTIGGTLGAFTSVWETNASDIYGDDTASTLDSGASGGVMVRTSTWGTDTLALRLTVLLDDIGIWDVHKGEFTVLLRARITDTLVADVQLRSGYYNLGPMRSHRRQTISSTNYMLYPVGVVKIPSADLTRAPYSYMQNFALQLYAGVNSGSGNLESDCFILIPRSEGHMYVSGGQVSSTNSVIVGQEPDGSVYAVSYGTGTVTTPAIAQPANYGVPIGGGEFIVAAQRADEHSLTDRVHVTLNYASRWDTLRGADTS